MWLLIDDVRDLHADLIVRTGELARHVLAIPVEWDCIMFDHDLGDVSEVNGYEILKWALETNNLRTNRVQLVTSNPVGRQNMANLLKDNKFVNTHNGPDFFLVPPQVKT